MHNDTTTPAVIETIPLLYHMHNIIHTSRIRIIYNICTYITDYGHRPPLQTSKQYIPIVFILRHGTHPWLMILNNCFDQRLPEVGRDTSHTAGCCYYYDYVIIIIREKAYRWYYIVFITNDIIYELLSGIAKRLYNNIIYTEGSYITCKMVLARLITRRIHDKYKHKTHIYTRTRRT